MAALIQANYVCNFGGGASGTATAVNASLGNLVVLAATFRINEEVALSSATFDGGSVSPVATVSIPQADGMKLIAWAFSGLSGAHDLVAALTVFPVDGMATALVISDANTTTPFGTPVGETGNADGSNPFVFDVVVTGADSNAVVIGLVRVREDVAITAPTVTVVRNSLTDNGTRHVILSAPGAASVTIAAQYDGSTFAIYGLLGVAINGVGAAGNASGDIATATATTPDGAASSSRSLSVTLRNGAGTLLSGVTRRFWTRSTLDAAAVDGGAGGLSVTCNSVGVFSLTDLNVGAGAGWLTYKSPSDDLNCHTVPVTFI